MTNVSYPEFKEKSFWGFVLYLRQWLDFDGKELSRLNRENFGVLKSDNIRRISQEYSVFRGTKLKEEKLIDGKNLITPAEWLARVVNEFDYSKHTSLEKKAYWCAERAREAINDNFIVGRQGSGMTKLLWFRCQENWTPYDKHASSAVDLEAKDNLDRMQEFYKILSCRGFDKFTKDIDKILQNEGFGELYGSRVIDAYLMLNSRKKPEKGKKPWPETAFENCKLFLDFLPNAFRSHAVSVGKKIPPELNNLLCNKDCGKC